MQQIMTQVQLFKLSQLSEVVWQSFQAIVGQVYNAGSRCFLPQLEWEL